MFWLIIDQSRAAPPTLHLWHKGHIALFFFLFLFQWTVAHLCFPAGYWCHTIHHLLLRGDEGTDSPTRIPSGSSLGSFPRPLVPSAVSQGRFQLNSPNVWDILIPLLPRLSLHPHLWSPDSGRVHSWIKPSHCSLCALVFCMEIRGTVWMGLAFMCLLRCRTESVLLDSVLTTVMVVSSAYVVEKKGPPCVI